MKLNQQNLIFVLILMLISQACVSTLYKTSQPNIILFFVDDLGWQDTSVPFWDQVTKFNKLYKTPNMKRLAAKGVKFTNAYSTTVCSPSRVSLMTGMNAARHRVTNWTLRPDTKQPMELNHPNLEFPSWNFNGIATSGNIKNAVYATSLPQLLNDKGYYTIHAGKGHFGAIGYSSENPINLGFDINIAGHAAGAPGSYLGRDNFGNGDPKRKIWAVPGLEKYHGKDIFLTQAITKEALSSLSKPIELDQPFFLYLSLYGVHTPFMADNRYINNYIVQGLSRQEAKYASMIESMDAALGKVLDFVENKGIANETVILFMSDNGGLSAVARGGEKHLHNAPLKSGKGSVYEGGIRVPMMAYWPGVTQENQIEETPVIIEDFFPSIINMAGINKYQTIQKIDGQSFVSLLKEEPNDLDERPLFWHYPNEWGPKGPGIGSFSAVRKGPWKLIYFHEDQHFELYNLTIDISEQNNLFQNDIKHSLTLVKILNKHLLMVDAQMPRNKITQQQIPWPSDVFN